MIQFLINGQGMEIAVPFDSLSAQLLKQGYAIEKVGDPEGVPPKDQIAKELKELKAKVTQLGHDHLHNIMPIYLERFSVELEPFILLEKSFDEAIKQFEYNAARVWDHKEKS